MYLRHPSWGLLVRLLGRDHSQTPIRGWTWGGVLDAAAQHTERSQSWRAGSFWSGGCAVLTDLRVEFRPPFQLAALSTADS
jgi:hypothetical protein